MIHSTPNQMIPVTGFAALTRSLTIELGLRFVHIAYANEFSCSIISPTSEVLVETASCAQQTSSSAMTLREEIQSSHSLLLLHRPAINAPYREVIVQSHCPQSSLNIARLSS